jgi:hypothetical protein
MIYWKVKVVTLAARFFSQRGGALPIIPGRSRGRFRAVGTQNLPTVAHSQTGALHAQPAPPIVRHAADNGQCGRLLRSFDPLHFHIQVRIRPQNTPYLCPQNTLNSFLSTRLTHYSRLMRESSAAAV